jgi:ABC-type multidrug transport system fused ATPase/permease subunit
VLTTLPDGLGTLLGQRAREVSGGQRQRRGLARALLADPDLLVLVSPTSAVDSHTESRIAERLRTARAGRTTVVVTSSPLLLSAADRVVLLRGGRVAAAGVHGELLEHDAGYRDIVGREEGLT